MTFTVAATASSGSLSYQWRKDGVSIPSATGTSYSLGTAQPWHIGDYSVVVSDTSGSVTSSVAALEITGVPTGLWKGLVGFYPLSGNANDRTAFARNGTVTGATTAIDRFNQASSAYSFNGTSHYISASASTLGWPAGAANRTVSIWFKTAGSTASGNIFALGKRASNQRFSLLLFNATTPAFIGEGNDQSYTTPTLAGSVWHQCVITYGDGGAGVGKVFIDGVKLTTPVSSWTKTLATDGTQPLYLAVNAQQQGEYFAGSLDDARIYNRALSEAEVTSLYAMETGPMLAVMGNGVVVANGDATPSLTDHTHFGSVTASTSLVRTFTLQNPSANTTALTLGTPQITGTGAAAFSVTSTPAASLASGVITTLEITFTPELAGQAYQATITLPNSSGTTPAFTFAISGDTLSPPTITTQPQAVSAGSGQAAAFAVTATGDALAYQWFKDGAAIPGATAASYSLTSAQPWHIGLYTVQVSNAAGSVTSDAAALTLTGVDTTVWSGLVGYYPLDGNADDATAFARHGTITGATTAIGRDGQTTKAYAFSGSSQYLTAAAGSTGWPGGSSSRTVSLWYKANAHSGNLFSFGQNTASRRFSILLQGTTQMSFIGGSNDNAYTTGSQTGTGWHHLVITYGDGGTGIGKVFIDGAQLTTPAASWTKTDLDTDGTQPFQLGTVAGANGEYFNGSLDDVRIYSRALTASDVSALYTSERASITVSGNGQPISVQDSTPSSTDHTDFGTVDSLAAGSVVRTFTLTNSSATTLVPSVTVNGSTAFAVTTAPAASVAPGGTTTFTLTFAPATAGAYSATVSVAGGGSSFDFAIKGTGAGVGWPDALNPAPNQEVFASVMQPDGKILLAGAFTTIAGGNRNKLARLNADGSLDINFNPDVNNTVQCIALQSDGKILIGGNFTTVGGLTRQYVARLNADGSLDSSFVDPAVLQPGTFAILNSLAVQTDGKILIGGYFSMVGGVSKNYIARLNADGTLDTSFSTTVNSPVNGICLLDDGRILIGGTFTTVNSATHNGLAKLNSNGGVQSFAPDFNANVNCLASLPDGKILVGGAFSSVNGVTRGRIAKLNEDGTLDTAYSSAIGVFSSGEVITLCPQADGKVLIGGLFNQISGMTRSNIARLSADGSLDTAFDPAASSSVLSIVLQADGGVLLGGSFTSLQPNGGAAAINRNNFARLNNEAASQTLSSPSSQQITWTHNGTAPLVEQVSFALSTDGGSSYTALAGTPTRIGTTSSWQLGGQSLPLVGKLRARGRVAGGYRGGSSGLVEQIAAFGSGLAIRGNSTLILPGDSTPSATDNTDFGNSATGGSITRTFTIENASASAIQLTGTPLASFGGVHAADFSLTTSPAATLAPGDTTSFVVTFVPGGSGLRSATLSIASDDSLLSAYTFAIQALRLSATTDTDSDGLNDAAEYQMAALGFDWEVNQTPLVQTLTSNATTAGLYNLTQVQQLNVGTPVLVRNNATGTFKLTFGLQQSSNLTNFTPMPFTSGTTTINGRGQIEFEFAPSGTAPSFYRVGAQ